MPNIDLGLHISRDPEVLTRYINALLFPAPSFLAENNRRTSAGPGTTTAAAKRRTAENANPGASRRRRGATGAGGGAASSGKAATRQAAAAASGVVDGSREGCRRRRGGVGRAELRFSRLRRALRSTSRTRSITSPQRRVRWSTVQDLLLSIGRRWCIIRGRAFHRPCEQPINPGGSTWTPPFLSETERSHNKNAYNIHSYSTHSPAVSELLSHG